MDEPDPDVKNPNPEISDWPNPTDDTLRDYRNILRPSHPSCQYWNGMKASGLLRPGKFVDSEDKTQEVELKEESPLRIGVNMYPHRFTGPMRPIQQDLVARGEGHRLEATPDASYTWVSFSYEQLKKDKKLNPNIDPDKPLNPDPDLDLNPDPETNGFDAGKPANPDPHSPLNPDPQVPDLDGLPDKHWIVRISPKDGIVAYQQLAVGDNPLCGTIRAYPQFNKRYSVTLAKRDEFWDNEETKAATGVAVEYWIKDLVPVVDGMPWAISKSGLKFALAVWMTDDPEGDTEQLAETLKSCAILEGEIVQEKLKTERQPDGTKKITNLSTVGTPEGVTFTLHAIDGRIPMVGSHALYKDAEGVNPERKHLKWFTGVFSNLSNGAFQPSVTSARLGDDVKRFTYQDLYRVTGLSIEGPLWCWYLDNDLCMAHQETQPSEEYADTGTSGSTAPGGIGWENVFNGTDTGPRTFRSKALGITYNVKFSRLYRDEDVDPDATDPWNNFDNELGLPIHNLDYRLTYSGERREGKTHPGGNLALPWFENPDGSFSPPDPPGTHLFAAAEEEERTWDRKRDGFYDNYYGTSFTQARAVPAVHLLAVVAPDMWLELYAQAQVEDRTSNAHSVTGNSDTYPLTGGQYYALRTDSWVFTGTEEDRDPNTNALTGKTDTYSLSDGVKKDVISTGDESSNTVHEGKILRYAYVRGSYTPYGLADQKNYMIGATLADDASTSGLEVYPSDKPVDTSSTPTEAASGGYWIDPDGQMEYYSWIGKP